MRKKRKKDARTLRSTHAPSAGQMPGLPVGFMAWAKTSGIHLSPSLCLSYSPELGHHLLAAAPLPKGALLLSVPLRACHTAPTSSPLAAELCAAGVSPLFVACAVLARTLAAGAGGAHVALLLSLPPVHNVARWGSAELPVAARYADALPALRRAGAPLPTAAHFELAASLLLSRGFSLPCAGAVAGAPVLAPVLDLLNHSPSPSAAVHSGAAALECRALRALAAGEEVRISYGALSDAELAYRYGFTLCRAAPPAPQGRARKRPRAASAQAGEPAELPLLGLTLGNPHNTVALPWAAVFAATAALAALWAPTSLVRSSSSGSSGSSPHAEVLALLAPRLLEDGAESSIAVGGAGLPAALVHAVQALLLAGEMTRAQRLALARRAVAPGAGEACAPCREARVRAALCALFSQRLKAVGGAGGLEEDYAWWAEAGKGGGAEGGKGGRKRAREGGGAGASGLTPHDTLLRQVAMGEREILVSHMAALS